MMNEMSQNTEQKIAVLFGVNTSAALVRLVWN